MYAIHAIQSVEANYKTAAVGAWRGQVTVNRVCVKVLQVTDDTLAAYRYTVSLMSTLSVYELMQP